MALSYDISCRRARAEAARCWGGELPEESDDFSWGDVFDVLSWRMACYAREESMYPMDLPPMFVRALQWGVGGVDGGVVESFYRRQGIQALKLLDRRRRRRG